MAITDIQSSNKPNLFLQKIQNWSQKTASEPHFRAIKDGLLTSIPFLMLAGFMILINYVLIPYFLPEHTDKYQEFGNKILNGSMNIYALLMLIFITNSLSTQKQIKNVAIPITVAIGAYFTTLEILDGKILLSHFGQGSMFMAIIVSLSATDIFCYCAKNKRFRINIGANVPEAVNESFNAMFPIFVTLLFFGLVAFTIKQLSGLEIQEFITNTIQKPLIGFTTSPFGFLFLSGLGIFLFSLGIHPSGVIPFVDPVLTTAATENMQAFQAGLTIPHIITTPFRDIYGHIGGTGQTLALVVAIFIFAKNQANKTFAKLTMPTSIFNINEPIIFGFPIVMNPIMMMPFLIIPLICFTLSYIATYFNLIGKIVMFVPWSTPPIINAYLATVGDLRNVAFQILLFVLSVLIYIPFLKIHESQMSLNVVAKDDSCDDFSDFAEFKNN